MARAELRQWMLILQQKLPEMITWGQVIVFHGD
jgi:hypothetical protein